MKVALIQFNPTVGDLRGNAQRILDHYRAAVRARCDLAVFPELSLNGYPPRDLVEDPLFLTRTREQLDLLAAATGETGLLVGFVDGRPAGPGHRVANAAALLHRGKILAVRHKTLLPTYDVFDEWRHFEPAISNTPVRFKGRRLGITICEDMWNVPGYVPEGLYTHDPVGVLAKSGVDLFINISSSPFHRGKTHTRLELVRQHVTRHQRPFLFVNQIGGNDELIFDGNSFALNPQGALLAHGPAFAEGMIVVQVSQTARTIPAPKHEDIEEVCSALTLGLRDYVRKCGFRDVVLGLSGGIDSAVTAALAVRALGADHVTGVGMPSEFSSRGSVEDAKTLANHLGIAWHQIGITPIFDAFKTSLRKPFRGRKPDVTEENLQARIRGCLLMAFSNKTGALLLTTGNKSEISMGYCTLYGDMNGGLAVIADVPKTVVYPLGRELNRLGAGIPEATFTKPPSAELRPNQTDQDTLPPYETLDAIMEAYIEQRQSAETIAAKGYPLDLVRNILNAIDRNEYKRRQAAPGLRITPKAFGMGRRFPIARGSYR